VLIVVVSFLAESTVSSLAGTTALLLLCVFTVVNLAVLVLRKDEPHHDAFRAPTAAPVVAGLACLLLATPVARAREDWIQYQIAGALLGVGVLLWAVTAVINRRSRHQGTGFRDIEKLDG
jgi:amino acid transporter